MCDVCYMYKASMQGDYSHHMPKSLHTWCGPECAVRNPCCASFEMMAALHSPESTYKLEKAPLIGLHPLQRCESSFSLVRVTWKVVKRYHQDLW